MVPDLTELEATIARMEEHFRDDPLFASYRRLCERFAADLAEPRDLALSQAAALMLVKYSAQDRDRD